MDIYNKLNIQAGKAICYSGFREDQRPGEEYPDYRQVKEDLLLLQGQWKYLRLFDCDQHSKTVLNVITKENLDFKVMLGAYIEAEMNNFNCPWGGGVYPIEQLQKNRITNPQKIRKLIEFANQYPDIIFSLSVGNEACVDWTDHYVHETKVLEYVKLVKEGAKQPVTFCENYAAWIVKLKELTEEVDFISIHTYPVWEYKHIDEALGYTKENFYSVAKKYPDKPIAITEAGWATNSNGRGINPTHVNETFQKIYFEKLMEWAKKENILVFFFEAFDETWKGSHEPLEPEKHWGLFKVDRTPKLAIKHIVENSLR